MATSIDQRREGLQHMVGADVSRETVAKLDLYVGLLQKWTQRINLIAPSTVGGIWERHILDSAQLWPLAKGGDETWIDIGSGGGLPGVVLACLASGMKVGPRLTLIEADNRKTAFLLTVRRELDLAYDVISNRVEKVSLSPPSVISCRAFAPLKQSFSLAEHLIGEKTRAVFLKGRNYQSEVEAASVDWTFTLKVTASKTNSESAVLVLEDIRRATP